MTLKVCHLVSMPDMFRAERPMRLLANHLDSQRFESHKFYLSRSNRSRSVWTRSGFSELQISAKGSMDAFAFVQLVEVVRKIAPHIVHTWSTSADCYGILAAKRAKVPVVVTSQRSNPSLVSPGYSWFHRWVLPTCNCVIANSNSVASLLTDSIKPPRLVRTIPDAANSHALAKLPRDEFFSRLNLPPRRFVVGVVAPLIATSELPDLIYAAELLRVALKDVWLVILGDGPQRKYLQKLRDQYGAQDAVRFVGDREDVAELTATLDALWVGSHKIGLNSAVLDAMSAGIPVIAANAACNREILVDGQTGILFQPGDVGGLARITYNLLQEDDRRTQLGRAASQYAMDHHSIESFVAAYSDLYEELWASK